MRVLVTWSYRPQEVDYEFPPEQTNAFRRMAKALGRALAQHGDVLVLQWSNKNIASQLGAKDDIRMNPGGHPYWQTADFYALSGYLDYLIHNCEERQRPNILIDVAGTNGHFPNLGPFPHPSILEEGEYARILKESSQGSIGPEPFEPDDWVDIGTFVDDGTVKLFERREASTNALRQKLLEDLVSEVDAVVIIGGGKATKGAGRVALDAGKLIPLTAFCTTPTMSIVEHELSKHLTEVQGHLERIFEGGSDDAEALAKEIPWHLQSLAFCEHGIRRGNTIEHRRKAAKDPSRARSLSIIRQSDVVKRILMIGTEWGSGHGGLSTINREMATAFAQLEFDVCCLLPSFTEADTLEANQKKVTLVAARSGQNAALEKPNLPDGWEPHLIIGHGRVTGPDADVIQGHFPQSLRAHVVHVVPRDIEYHKEGRDESPVERASRLARIERDLARRADVVIAIGPRIHRSIESELQSKHREPFRFDPGFDGQPVAPVPSTKLSVLAAGRAEDYKLKGFDIAAAAMGWVAKRRPAAEPSVEFAVLGAPLGQGDALRERLVKDADCYRLEVQPLPYENDAAEIDHRYRQSSLVLMPSRGEGFGLVGHEAIVRGIPVLITRNSGLAELIIEIAPEKAKLFVVPVTCDVERDAPVWGKAIARMLKDRHGAFREAKALRRLLMNHNSWREQARSLVEAAVKARPTRSSG